MSRALESLGRVDAPIAGLVLNRASESVSFTLLPLRLRSPGASPRRPKRNGKHGKSVRVPEEVGAR